MNDSEEKGGKDPSPQDVPVYPKNGPAICGPGCNCGAPSGNNRTKLAIFLVVMLAAAGIIGYKAVSDSNNNVSKAGSAFAVEQKTTDAMPGVEAKSSSVAEQQLAEQIPVPASNPTATNGMTSAIPGVVDKSSSVTPQNMNKKSAIPGEKSIAANGTTPEPAKGSQKIGEYLESLSDLNKVAVNQDAVFVFIPSIKDDVAGGTTRSAVLSAQKSLDAKNIKVGLYSLQTASPDYSMISSKVQLPAVLVACRGKGMGAVSGEVTETKLLQAFMAVSRAGSCAPSGCGPSAKGCN